MKKEMKIYEISNLELSNLKIRGASVPLGPFCSDTWLASQAEPATCPLEAVRPSLVPLQRSCPFWPDYPEEWQLIYDFPPQNGQPQTRLQLQPPQPGCRSWASCFDSGDCWNEAEPKAPEDLPCRQIRSLLNHISDYSLYLPFFFLQESPSVRYSPYLPSFYHSFHHIS